MLLWHSLPIALPLLMQVSLRMMVRIWIWSFTYSVVHCYPFSFFTAMIITGLLNLLGLLFNYWLNILLPATHHILKSIFNVSLLLLTLRVYLHIEQFRVIHYPLWPFWVITFGDDNEIMAILFFLFTTGVNESWVLVIKNMTGCEL